MPCWTARYRTAKGTEYEIEGTEERECPVSRIGPQAAEVVRMLSRARHAKDGAGAALFGPDLSKWPAWVADAAVVVEIERIKEYNACTEAELSEMDEE